MATRDALLDNSSVVGATNHRQSAIPKPLRIVHVVSSLNVGGMERMLLQLANAQQMSGHQVAILSIRGGPLEQEAASRSLRTFVLNGSRVARVLSALRFFFTERPDIVHVHNPTSLKYAVLSKMIRSSIIVTLHGDQNTHARLGSAFEWSQTSAAVVVSHAAIPTLHLPRQAGRLTVIHNGVGEPSALPVRRTPNATATPVVGIMVARMDGRKGHHTLLRALHHLKQEGISVQMCVVGDGDHRENIEGLTRELGLSGEQVRFLGRRSDIDTLLGRADFFVLPSDVEGLPMAVLEAMSHGLPVIASNVGGIPEVIRAEVEGLLIPPGDPAALAQAIQRLADDPRLRRSLGDAARKRAASEFSLGAMTVKYDRVYSDAMRHRR